MLSLRAIGIEEKALGSNHPELAKSLNSRAIMLGQQVTRVARRGRFYVNARVSA